MKTHSPTKPLTKNGFTLIELMITVAIIAILASIAYPSYLEQIYKTRRAGLATDILECATVLERRYTLNNTYTADACDFLNARNDDYTIAITLPDDNDCVSNNDNNSCFTITAIASSDSMLRNAKCRTFSYDHLGAHRVLDSAENDTTDQCWSN